MKNVQLLGHSAKRGPVLAKVLRESAQERARDPISELSIFQFTTPNLVRTVLICANSIRSSNKALSNCYYNLYKYSRAALQDDDGHSSRKIPDDDQWFDQGFIKVSMI